jgi:hypothetical protein
VFDVAVLLLSELSNWAVTVSVDGGVVSVADAAVPVADKLSLWLEELFLWL